jgi:hypothetical protein
MLEFIDKDSPNELSKVETGKGLSLANGSLNHGDLLRPLRPL